MPALPETVTSGNLRVAEGVDREALFGVAGIDAVDRFPVNLDNALVLGTVGSQGRLAAVADNQILVGQGIWIQRQRFNANTALFLAVQRLNQLRFHPVQTAAAGVEAADILDMVGGVILGHQPDRLGLHPQVDVLGHQDVAAGLVGMGQVIADVEDLMIRLGSSRKMLAQVLVQRLFELDRHPALVRSDPDPAVEQLARA